MGNYTNEIEQFIYEICYMPMWEAVNAYITQHPYVLDLKYSKIKYPDSVLLEDMVLQFPTNIRATGDTLSFDAVVSCTLNLTELQDFIRSQPAELTEFDEVLVRRWFKQITVYEDHYTVELKSGLSVDIDAE